MAVQQRMSDERLCWLAVEDRLRKHRSPRSRMVSVLVLAIPSVLGYLTWRLPGLVSGALVGMTIWVAIYRTRRMMGGSRMPEYSVAVNQVVKELAPHERQHLRATGQVPSWFLERVVAARQPL
jgi:hypothetical protein